MNKIKLHINYCVQCFVGLILFLFVGICATAQVKITGQVQNISKEKLESASIKNKSQNTGVYTDVNGKYFINGYIGDTIECSYIGYEPYKFVVNTNLSTLEKKITLYAKSSMLKGVTISGLTAYQKDSVARAKLYEKPMGYEQETSIMSPASALYQQFSKRYKNLRKFQEQFVSMEQQKFIDTKYNYELVQSQTKLEGEEAAMFMNAHPMPYDFARAANELELKMWVRTEFKRYIANKEKLK